MMKVTALVIDDELSVLHDTVDELSRIPYLDIKGSFKSLKDAKDYFKDSPPVDILFCDIQMPDLDGLSARDQLSGKYSLLVYVTGFEERAKEAFDVYADGFLTKPLDHKEVLPLIAKLGVRRPPKSPTLPPQIFVRDDAEKNWVRVSTKDITQMKVWGNYLRVYAPDFKGTLRMSMEKAEETFPSDYCMRVNQSTMVVYEAIRRFDRELVYVVGDKDPIKVSDMGKAAFEAFKRRAHPSH